MTKTPFISQSERASDLLGLVHTDVCGPMSSIARGGFQYFITFSDDFSRYGYVYLMMPKFESFENSRNFRVKYRINWARQLNFYDLIVGVNV
jgi:hypothetical protein